MKASSLTSLIFKELTGKEILPAQEAFLDEVAPIVADFKYDLLEPPSSTSVALSVACKKDDSSCKKTNARLNSLNGLL